MKARKKEHIRFSVFILFVHLSFGTNLHRCHRSRRTHIIFSFHDKLATMNLVRTTLWISFAQYTDIDTHVSCIHSVFLWGLHNLFCGWHSWLLLASSLLASATNPTQASAVHCIMTIPQCYIHLHLRYLIPHIHEHFYFMIPLGNMKLPSTVYTASKQAIQCMCPLHAYALSHMPWLVHVLP